MSRDKDFTRSTRWGQLQVGNTYKVRVNHTSHIGTILRRERGKVFMHTGRFDEVEIHKAHKPQFFRR